MQTWDFGLDTSDQVANRGGMYEIKSNPELKSILQSLIKTVEGLACSIKESKSNSAFVSEVQSKQYVNSCQLCQMADHIASQCHIKRLLPLKMSKLVLSQPTNLLPANTFGNTYHPDMCYHPDFSWRQNQPQMQRPNASGFNQHRPNFSQFRQMQTKEHHHTWFQIKVPLSPTIKSLLGSLNLPIFQPN